MLRYEESCAAAREGLASETDDEFLHRVLVHNLVDHMRDYEGALIAIEQAIEYGNDFVGRKAEVLEKLGRTEEAISTLRAVSYPTSEIMAQEENY